jgi:hypothetical protein
MASTEALAAAFKIKPKALKNWLDGKKPTNARDIAIYEEIFKEFEYRDGQWFQKSEGGRRKSEVGNSDQLKSDAGGTPSEQLPKNNEEMVTGHWSLVTEKDKESDPSFFQAVGIITGEVNFTPDGKCSVTIGGKEYPLYWISRKRIAFEGLKKEIEATGKRTQRLIVYPKVQHYPKKEQLYQLSFQLVGFDRGKEPEGISDKLGDNEFKFSGLWQFIPVCQTPCISVFKNFTRERLDFIKQADPALKVKFMKASHIPVLWKDAPVRPFRFTKIGNRELLTGNSGEQKEKDSRPFFVEIKAKFLPHRDVFGFVELLSEPKENAPRFLKASKKDKTEVQQTSKGSRKSESQKHYSEQEDKGVVPPISVKGAVVLPKPKLKS